MAPIRIAIIAAVVGPLLGLSYDFHAEEVCSGLTAPVGAVVAPGVANTLFVIEQHTGHVRLVNLTTGAVAATPFLTVPSINTGSEQGLLGIAFHPSYATNGRLFVYCTRNGAATGDGTPSGAGRVDIVRYTAVGTPATATAAGSPTTVLSFNQPESNHNGGWLGFGPDGMLYIASGDGGGGGDNHGAFGNAQNRANRLGKMLRINVDGATATIPSDNPYADSATFAREIWSWGLRNPWRCSFDRATGDLWIGDVGQNQREEVSVGRAGGRDLNYGWRVWEGTYRYNASENLQGGYAHTPPIVEYGRSLGTTVIGGYVYRGSAMPWLVGRYLYGDYGSGRFWARAFDAGVGTASDEVTSRFTPAGGLGNIASFAEDHAGELYLISRSRNRVFKIVPSGPQVTTASPLPASSVGVAYPGVTFAANGGSTPYVWTVSAGALPTGLTLTTAGLLAGTPTVNGTFAFTVQASGGGTGTKAMSLTINPAPAITTASPLPGGAVGAAYSQALASSGGTGTRTYTLSAGTLPTGLTMGSAGVISGTPTTVAVAQAFTVRVTDSVGANATRAFTMTIAAADAAPSITSTPGELRVRVGTPFTYDVNATGAPTPTYALTVAPTGMTINSTTGVITWIPVTTGFFAVTVQAVNGVNPAAVQSFTVQSHDHGLARRSTASPYLGMSSTSATASPASLSDTGLFSNTTSLTPAAALIPYGVNVPFWSDGAAKRRWISVPNDGAPYGSGETVGFAATGEWTFPAGTVFVKHFDLDLDDGAATVLRRLETRVLVMQAGGAYGVTYRWNEAQTTATRVDDAAIEDITIAAAGGGTRTLRWQYPSPGDCMQCHTSTSGRVLGVNARQLHGSYAYAAGSDNQLRTLNFIGLFTSSLSDADITGITRLYAAQDSAASIEQRARSYLDVNCGYCHRPGGAPSHFDARYHIPLGSQGIINGAVYNSLDTADAGVVVPGDLHRSILYRRVDTIDPAIRMPGIGRTVLDEEGRALLAAWIDGMPPTDGGEPPPPVSDGHGLTSSGEAGGCGWGTAIGLIGLLSGMMLMNRRRWR